VSFTIPVNGKEAARGQVTQGNTDVLQQFDPKGHVRAGPDGATAEERGETGLLYQVVCRHFEPHKADAKERPGPEVVIGCDRTRLSTADVLRAKAAVRPGGKGPTCVVSVGLGPSPSAPTPPPATRP
jgi:hypothetical protein